MGRLLASIFFCLLCFVLSAQSEENKANQECLYIEFGGAGIFGSLNYELGIPIGNSNVKFTSGVGATFYSASSHRYSYALPRIGLSLEKKHLSTGLGICAPLGWYGSLGSSGKWPWSPKVWYTDWYAHALPYMQIRVRTSGFFAGVTGYLMVNQIYYGDLIDILNDVTEDKYFKDRWVLVWPGLSLGYTFPHKREKKQE